MGYIVHRSLSRTKSFHVTIHVVIAMRVQGRKVQHQGKYTTTMAALALKSRLCALLN